MDIQIFDYSVDVMQVLLWQYNDATSIQSLLLQKQSWYEVNQENFWESWFNDVFNLITANEFGLVVWAIILDLPLFIGPTPDPPNKPIFGFNYYSGYIKNLNFENGNFSNLNSTNNLTIAEKRLLLRLRFFQLTSRCAIPEINNFLKYLFGTEGPTYLLDRLDMSITLIFLWPVNRRLVENILRFDLIPRGAGVKLRTYINPVKVFGFGRHNQNFGNGCFIQEF